MPPPPPPPPPGGGPGGLGGHGAGYVVIKKRGRETAIAAGMQRVHGAHAFVAIGVPGGGPPVLIDPVRIDPTASSQQRLNNSREETVQRQVRGPANGRRWTS